MTYWNYWNRNRTLLKHKLRTVRGMGPDCPQAKFQKHGFAERVMFLVWKWTPDCPGLKAGLSADTVADCPLSVNRESARTKSLKNHLSYKIDPISLKSKPTVTKLGKDDHKPVRKLSLRGHRPIWDESTENQKGRKKHPKIRHDLDLPRSTISWGIGWFPSVQRLNSRYRSNQRNKNESKRSRKNESKARTRRQKMNSWRTQITTRNTNSGGHKVVRATIPTW
jgi:hypothetical protein